MFWYTERYNEAICFGAGREQMGLLQNMVDKF